LNERKSVGKRSDFQRHDKDFYRTPYEAVVPLLPHIAEIKLYIEPCCGDGALVKHLDKAMVGTQNLCLRATDVFPQTQWAIRKDALSYTDDDLHGAGAFITNPPWSREMLHSLIHHLSSLLPTWLLFDADWMHTKQSAELIKHCERIVSVGRVKWFPESKMTGKDNCCWYLFDKHWRGIPKFYGREI
jgi:hypothetical protein